LHTNLAPPLGISFFTFQGISNLIDIARGEVAPQRSLMKFATYKAMFPQADRRADRALSSDRRRIDGRRVGLYRLRHGAMLFTLRLAQCLVRVASPSWVRRPAPSSTCHAFARRGQREGFSQPVKAASFQKMGCPPRDRCGDR
jgi:hypothetical protein